MNVWMKAAMKKWRFHVNGNVLAVEDLFDLTVDGKGKITLIKVVKALQKELNSTDDTDVSDILKDVIAISDSSKVTEIKDKINLVKEVIRYKVEEQKRKEEIVARKQYAAKIKEILAEKKFEDLKNKSAEELENMLKNMEVESIG